MIISSLYTHISACGIYADGNRKGIIFISEHTYIIIIVTQLSLKKRLSRRRGEHCATKERAHCLDLFNMTSVDSGVETGNDSNDSSSVQHETQQQHVTAGQVTSSIIFPDYGISPINNNELKIDQYYDNRPCQIRMKCPNDLAFTVPRLCFKTDGFDFTAAYKRKDRIWEDNTVLQNDKLSNTEIDKVKVNSCL